MRYLLIAILLSFNAYAVNEIESTRNSISTSLNEVVKDLKNQIKPLDSSLKDNLESTKTLEEEVDILLEKSDKKEINPTLLNHGKAEVETNCDYDSQNLNWTGSKWRCMPVHVLSDCVAASDEYKVQNPDGSYSCQKSETSSGSVNTYWKFLGHAVQCGSSDANFPKVYGCFYKNKLNQEIQVADADCSGKTKPSAASKACAKGCSKYSQPAVYCGKTHGTVVSSKDSYESGQSELVGVISTIDRKYEVEYTITCDDGTWKESGSKVLFNYQTGEEYKCPVTYTCSPYGSGWSLSGTTCTKSSYVYKNYTCQVYQTSSTYACNGSCRDSGYTHNGCVYVPKCDSGYTLVSGKCRKSVTETKPAIKN
jgi:hypothetical protein